MNRIIKTFMVIAVVGVISILSAQERVETISSVELFINSVDSMYRKDGEKILLPVPGDSSITINLHFYSYEDGYLSLQGTVLNNNKSECIVKGTLDKLYGWIHIFAEPMEDGVVYQYTTDSKRIVSVKDAAVSDIISIQPVGSETTNSSTISLVSRAVADSSLKDLPDIVFIKPMAADANINKLQSKPKSNRVIWMDIRQLMDGDDPIAYSRDDMIQMWQVVANGLSMYDVNVTTDIDVFSATPPQYRGIGLFHNNDIGRSHCAYDGFGTEYDCEIYLKSSGFNAGRSALHEYGHLLGLKDMGTGLNGVQWATYFPGYDELKWVPIMGNFLYSDDWGEETLYQWSNGDFSAGMAHGMPEEDALAIINGHLEVEPDDIVDPKPLLVKDGIVSMKENYGMINVKFDEFDEDEFSFVVTEPESEVDLLIDRIGIKGGSMLDVHAYLLDESGTILEENNQLMGRYAIIQSVLAPGTYTLRIAGGAEGQGDTAFPRYGSVGYYAIKGTVASAHTVNNRDIINQRQKMNLSFVNNTIQYRGFGSAERTELAVFSLNGRQLFKQTLHGSGSINFQKRLGSGSYILTVRSASQNYIQKFSITGK